MMCDCPFKVNTKKKRQLHSTPVQAGNVLTSSAKKMLMNFSQYLIKAYLLVHQLEENVAVSRVMCHTPLRRKKEEAENKNCSPITKNNLEGKVDQNDRATHKLHHSLLLGLSCIRTQYQEQLMHIPFSSETAN